VSRCKAATFMRVPGAAPFCVVSDGVSPLANLMPQDDARQHPHRIDHGARSLTIQRLAADGVAGAA